MTDSAELGEPEPIVGFSAAYLAGSLNVWLFEAQYTCGSPDPHSTPCEWRGLAFVPFAHYLGGGDMAGALVGAFATAVEVVSLVVFIVGVAVRRPRRRAPGPGEVRLSGAVPGADVGLALDVVF